MPLVPNLRLRALEGAVREAESALDEVAPTGANPTARAAGILTTAWVSDAAEAEIADLDGEGRVVRAGFEEALERLRSLARAEAAEPMVAEDDARASAALYPDGTAAP